MGWWVVLRVCRYVSHGLNVDLYFPQFSPEPSYVLGLEIISLLWFLGAVIKRVEQVDKSSNRTLMFFSLIL